MHLLETRLFVRRYPDISRTTHDAKNSSSEEEEEEEEAEEEKEEEEEETEEAEEEVVRWSSVGSGSRKMHIGNSINEPHAVCKHEFRTTRSLQR